MPAKKIKSIQKCSQILSIFEQKSQLDMEEIIPLLGMPKSSIYRYLKNLCDASLLDYESVNKKYSVGPIILRLGAKAISQERLPKIARPFMEKFAQEQNETIFLTAVRGHRAICIERVECRNSFRFIVNRGDSFPLYASAIGRILMAYLPAKQQEQIISKGLKKLTPKTIIEPEKLRKGLAHAKEVGFCYSDEELNPGGRSVAAPIFNSFGRVVAGLGVAVPINRFPQSKLKEFSEAILECARKISSQLGYCQPL
jgi:IclR family transcriptional regulator, KDG regulon repressor